MLICRCLQYITVFGCFLWKFLRTKNSLEQGITLTSQGILPSICDSLYKYNLFHYLELWFSESIFSTYTNWKTIVKTKILEKEIDDWNLFCIHHDRMRVAQVCLENISPINSGPLLLFIQIL